MITILSYLARVIRSKLASDGPQPVVQSEPKISLEVLLGWVHLKARLEGVDIEEMKQLLLELAEVEHQLIRFKQMVDKAESIGVAELSEQQQIDKNVMRKILLKIQQEAVSTKTALCSLVADGLLRRDQVPAICKLVYFENENESPRSEGLHSLESSPTPVDAVSQRNRNCPQLVETLGRQLDCFGPLGDSTQATNHIDGFWNEVKDDAAMPILQKNRW